MTFAPSVKERDCAIGLERVRMRSLGAGYDVAGERGGGLRGPQTFLVLMLRAAHGATESRHETTAEEARLGQVPYGTPHYFCYFQK